MKNILKYIREPTKIKIIYDEIIQKKSWLSAYSEIIKIDDQSESYGCSIYFSLKSDVLFRVGKYHESLVSIYKAIELENSDHSKSSIYVQLAGILYSIKKYTEALQACETALLLDQRNTLGQIQRSSILMGLGRYFEAKTGFEKLSNLNSYQVEFNRVSCIYYMGKTKDCEKEIETISKKYGYRPELARLKANILIDNNKIHDALKIIKLSIHKNKDYLPNWLLLIRISQSVDQVNNYWKEAIKIFGRTWALDSTKINYYIKIGEYSKGLEELDSISYETNENDFEIFKASIYYEMGNYSTVSFLLSNVLKRNEEWRAYDLACKVWLKEHSYAKAEQAIINALRLSPYDISLNYLYAKILNERKEFLKSSEILSKISYVSFGFYDDNNVKARFEKYINSLQIHDWTNWDDDIKFIKDKIDLIPLDDTIFYLHATPNLETRIHKIIAEKKSKFILDSTAEIRNHLNFKFEKVEDFNKIKIGFLSMDFRNHAVSVLMAGLFEKIDKNNFQLHAFSYGPDDGSMLRKRIENAFEYFYECRSMSNIEIAKLIYSKKIDVLIDLAGYTKWNRMGIVALKPARIIAHAFGYTFTMGKEIVDYNLSDEILSENNENLELYSEKIINLPWISPADTSVNVPNPSVKMDHCLPNDKFIFCSFNQAYKLNPYIFNIWMEILQKCENSVLWLLSPNDVACKNLSKEAQTRGVDPKRLIFAKSLSLDEHYSRLQLADLALDTTPYGSNTTSVTALWCGLPVLALHGETVSSRGSASNLTAFGLEELIIKTGADEYINMAIKIYNDKKYHENLKKKIKDINLNGGGNLFNIINYTRNFEAAIRKMINDYK
jgi:tetratricopeptide (TPR) repeat protein